MNQSADSIEFSYTNRRIDFLRATLISSCILGLVTLVPSAFSSETTPVYRWLYVGAYLLLVSITVLPIPYSIRGVVFIGLMFSMGLAGLTETGIWGDARVFMLGAIILSSLLFTWRSGWILTILTALSYLIAGWFILSGVYTTTDTHVASGNLAVWIEESANVLILAVLAINGIRLTQVSFSEAQSHAQTVLGVIQDEKFTLEQRVEKRTQDLASANQTNKHRAQMFQAIAQVTRAILSTQNLQDLLPQITQAISQYFNFYHVGIFLIDTNKEFAILSAANSEGGQKMLERSHKLRVGQVDIVGYVAGAAKPRIALDTGADAIYFNNSDLPETRSEMALPLIQTGGQIIGVLDIQSIESNAFNREDIEILITLADQVSVAIGNARLYQETQKTLIEAETLYHRDLQTGWKKFTRSQKIAGVRRIGMNANLYSESIELPGAAEVISSGATHFKNDKNTQMTIPVKLRGEIVGLLNVKTDEEHTWTGDEMDIVTAIVERAALSIESARLLAESRAAADKERAIGEISAKISASTQIEMILKTAVRELGNQIGGAQISVEIGSEDE